MNKLHVMLVSSTAIGAALALGAPGLDQARLAPRWTNEALAQSPCAPANPCNPCNPAAAAAAAYGTKCVVPRLAQAAKANPCAAKSPCGASARAANPCNPCAAKANPCAAKANPCAASAPVELTDGEAKAAGDCLRAAMTAAYARSSLAVAKAYVKWPRYSAQAYHSATHGERFVANYANAEARAYGRYEKAGKMPVGARIAKDSFAVGRDGRVSVGPLFVMEKMPSGFLAASGNWKYTMIMPDGSLFGETKGRNSAGMQFCIACHQAAAEYDHLMFVPVDYRVGRR